jgi:hypothetical protein
MPVKSNNLNPALLASIAIEESGNGTNDATTSRNNPMSMGGGSSRYGSIRDGIFDAARNLRENYVDKGLKDVASIGRKYAPPGAANDVRGTNRLWPSDVTAIYNRITTAQRTQPPQASATRTFPGQLAAGIMPGPEQPVEPTQLPAGVPGREIPSQNPPPAGGLLQGLPGTILSPPGGAYEGRRLASAGQFNYELPRPASVEEARALPPGTHFIDPEGNRRMVA